MKEKFDQFGRWITKFVIDGVSNGGDFDAANDARIQQFARVFPDVQTVLELGALEGGHSFALSSLQSVKSVLAIELRSSNLEKARFVKNLLGDKKVDFIQADVENCDLTKFGSVDAVFCSGILYHLQQPWKLLQQCSLITSKLFLWTHYASESQSSRKKHGYRGKWYREGGILDPLSGASRYSFWLSLGSLLQILEEVGFTKVLIIENNLSHENGCAVTLAAIHQRDKTTLDLI